MERLAIGAPFSRGEGYTTTLLVDLINNLYATESNKNFLVVGRNRDHLRLMMDQLLDLIIYQFDDRFLVTTLQVSRGLIVTNMSQRIIFTTIDSMVRGRSLRGIIVHSVYSDVELPLDILAQIYPCFSSK